MSEQARRLLRGVLRLGHGVPEPPRTTAEWFTAHHAELVAAVAVGDDDALTLYAHAWAALPADADEAWWRGLYDVATPLSAALPRSGPLATALRVGAEALRARGLLRHAVALGVRELAVRRLLDDPDATAAALDSLAATYRAQGRPHRVIGCADEVLELRIRAGRPDGVARALAHLGTLMVEVGRPDTAVNYLTRAEKVFADLPPTPDRSAARVELARAVWLAGDEAAGRRRLRRALPELPDEQARRARSWLDLPPGTAPDEP
ncbi:tetratricopeptide repeat protein [Saccharothrix obliqua]|uniref:tetratricopeptide repeat protein n=1 Tax=Saccharothrix obliqua TaxID=2861747 RepID=UPI001C5E9AF2|nr:tetratricopeptide repeat protein [Saccharothrix obliqua]MBW4719065.1 tetratricopeptide repeat protein [Saccharothrix obliqua]